MLALTRALRARRARPPEVAENLFSCFAENLFSCFAAARAACVSTWLGEVRAARAACVSTWLGEVRQEHQSWLATNSEPCTCTQSHLSPRARFHFLRSDKKDLRIDVVNHCQTLPGLPRAAWPSGRFAEVATCLVNQIEDAARNGERAVGPYLSDVVRPSFGTI